MASEDLEDYCLICFRAFSKYLVMLRIENLACIRQVVPDQDRHAHRRLP